MPTRESKEFAATVSSKGRVVIPAEVRRRLGLFQGSVLRFVIDGDGAWLLRATVSVQRLKGRLAARPAPITIDDMNQAIAERRARIGGRGLARQRPQR